MPFLGPVTGAAGTSGTPRGAFASQEVVRWFSRCFCSHPVMSDTTGGGEEVRICCSWLEHSSGTAGTFSPPKTPGAPEHLPLKTPPRLPHPAGLVCPGGPRRRCRARLVHQATPVRAGGLATALGSIAPPARSAGASRSCSAGARTGRPAVTHPHPVAAPPWQLQPCPHHLHKPADEPAAAVAEPASRCRQRRRCSRSTMRRLARAAGQPAAAHNLCRQPAQRHERMQQQQQQQEGQPGFWARTFTQPQRG